MMRRPNSNLFDKIIAAIEREKELEQGKKLLAAFLTLLLGSAAFLPFSLEGFIRGWMASGTYYFIGTAVSYAAKALPAWQDFLFATVESFPYIPFIFFVINVACLLFAIRLFLHRQGLLLNYVKSFFA